MSKLIAILIAGISAGILIGLSSSPIVASVISALLAIAISGVALLAGIKHNKLVDPLSIDFWPVGLLFLGVTLGSLGGIRLRQADWLQSNPIASFNMWTKPPFNLPESKVANQMFDLAYPIKVLNKEKTVDRENHLYSSSVILTVCGKIDGADPVQIREIIQAESSAYWKQISQLTRDVDTKNLQSITKDLCITEPD